MARWSRDGRTPPEEAALTPLEQQCAPVADRLLVRYGWRLLDRAELARRAAAHMQAGEASTPQRAVMLAYSHALHRACAGTANAGARNTGYAELFGFLYAVARWRYPDVAEEAAQAALVRVFASFDRCRQPGAFLSFALQQLLSAVRAARRPPTHAPVPLDTGAPGEAAAGAEQADPAAGIIARELRERFARLADEFLRRHPRAGRQFAALRLKYVEGLDEAAVSRALGVPVQAVYVLRSRAIAKLRQEPGWRALAAEFGILPADAPGPEVQDQGRMRPLGGDAERTGRGTLRR
ncbi:MAG TPA: sigma-70 family RNA polymerase sigma factor [Roseiflexaceae bacterium]|nr:sigma-70 family RNA polymerase sigma factor [Roseiflexaceae bacterium]